MRQIGYYNHTAYEMLTNETCMICPHSKRKVGIKEALLVLL